MNTGVVSGVVCYTITNNAGFVEAYQNYDGNDYVDMTYQPFHGTNLTIGMWVMDVASVGNAFPIYLSADGYSDRVNLNYPVSGAFALQTYDVGYAQVSALTNCYTGNWYHVVGTMGPDTRQLRIYVNGIYQAVATANTEMLGLDRSTLGCRNQNSGTYKDYYLVGKMYRTFGANYAFSSNAIYDLSVNTRPK